MSKKILVADDSLTIQKVIELTFMDEAHDVTAVSDGQEAMDRLDDLTPDIVIADVHMPGLTGLDVCRRVKETTPGIPVLLLVGTFEPFEMDEAEKVNADAVLRKPFDSQELMEEVERLLASGGAEEASDASSAEADGDDGGESEAAAASVSADEGESADDSNEDSVPTGIAAETEVFALPDTGDQAPPSNWGFQQEAEPFRLGGAGQVEESAPVADPWQELDVSPSSQEESAPEAGAGQDEASDTEAVAEPEAAEVTASDAAVGAVDGAVEQGEDDAADSEQDAPVVSERSAMAWMPAAVEAPTDDASATEADSASDSSAGGLSDADVERIAQRVAEIVGDRVARDVAWEVIPDLAEVIIKDRLRELEAEVD